MNTKRNGDCFKRYYRMQFFFSFFAFFVHETHFNISSFLCHNIVHKSKVK